MVTNKFVELDYGRSTVGTGPFQYKTQWLAEPHSLEYISLENSNPNILNNTRKKLNRNFSE